MGKETPCWWWGSYISQGQSRWQSFVGTSLMPGLVANVVLCLGLIKNKSVKSNQIQAVHHRRKKTDRDLWIPCHLQTWPLAMIQVGHRHPLSAMMYSKDRGCHPGPFTYVEATTVWKYVLVRWQRKCGAAWALWRDGTGYSVWRGVACYEPCHLRPWWCPSPSCHWGLFLSLWLLGNKGQYWCLCLILPLENMGMSLVRTSPFIQGLYIAGPALHWMWQSGELAPSLTCSSTQKNRLCT